MTEKETWDAIASLAALNLSNHKHPPLWSYDDADWICRFPLEKTHVLTTKFKTGHPDLIKIVNETDPQHSGFRYARTSYADYSDNIAWHVHDDSFETYMEGDVTIRYPKYKQINFGVMGIYFRVKFWTCWSGRLGTHHATITRRFFTIDPRPFYKPNESITPTTSDQISMEQINYKLSNIYGLNNFFDMNNLKDLAHTDDKFLCMLIQDIILDLVMNCQKELMALSDINQEWISQPKIEPFDDNITALAKSVKDRIDWTTFV